MFTKFSRFHAFSVSLLILGTLSASGARADEPAPGASGAPAAAPSSLPSTVPAPTPSSAPVPGPVAAATGPTGESRPHVGPLVITAAGGGLGGTEAGPAVSGHVSAELPDGSTFEIDGTVGAPILRLHGHAEAIPIRILRRELSRRENGETTIALSFVPVSGDAQITLPLPGGLARQHFVVTPKLAAEFGYGQGNVYLTVKSSVAPVVGVAHDGDGTAFVLGSRIDLEGNLSIEIDRQNRVDLRAGIASYQAWTRDTNHSWDVWGSARYVRTLGTGQQVYIGPEARSTALDVNRGGNIDNGRSTVFGVVGGIAF